MLAPGFMNSVYTLYSGTYQYSQSIYGSTLPPPFSGPKCHPHNNLNHITQTYATVILSK